MVLGLDDSAICGQSGRETTIDGCRWIVAGVMAVMAVADTAKFNVERLKRRVF